MIHELGPRSRRIFDLFQARILSGELEPGARLAPHTRLAADFGVAPMTIRHVLARLEDAGLVSREPGRGTFVRTSAGPEVLVVARARVRAVLSDQIQRMGHRVTSVGATDAALTVLGADASFALVLWELVAGRQTSQTDFIRAVRQRWPRLPIAVVTHSAAALAPLHGMPESPVLVVPAPVRASQLEEVVRLVLPDASGGMHAIRPARAGAEPVATVTPASPLDGLFSRLPEAAFVIDRSTRRVVAWNPGAEALLGHTPAEAVGMFLEVLVPERVQAEVQARVAHPETSSGHPILDATEPVELPMLRAGGQEVWVELAASALADQLVLIVARDRSAQRTVHLALSFQARLLEAVEQAVVATDPLGRILYWNAGAERLYGWSADEVLGRSAGDVIVAPELLARGREIMALLREGKSWSGEFPVRRRDGTEIPVLVTDSPIRDIDGRLQEIIGVAADLTEHKQAELETLERARLEALLLATQAAQLALSKELALNVPNVGQLASDPRLPKHLRPIAGEVLNAVRLAAAQLEHPLALPGGS